MVSPNHILLQVDKALNDEILLEGGIKLYLDPTFRPEWNATVTGKVVSKPIHPKGENKKAIAALKVGDEVAFSYRVISDIEYGSSSDLFNPTTEGSDYYKIFANAKGEHLTIVAMPNGNMPPIWAACYNDKFGNLVDGTQGNESDVERWMAQFKFGNVQDGKFKNLFEEDGKDYWKSQECDVLAVKNGDDILPTSDLLICKPIEIDLTTRHNLMNGVSLPPMTIAARLYDRATLLHDAEDMGLKKGDVVSTQEQYIQKYDLWGKPYFLIPKRHIYGTWI